MAVEAQAPGRPPNGGWGWVVLFGVSVTYMTNMALFSVFGLLFGGQLEAWDLETTGVAIISSTMTSCQNFTGLIVGSLVKRISSKATTLVGGTFVAGGMILSYFATDPWHIFITWGILVGFGNGLLIPATFLNISSYFSTRRSQAVGISLAGTGFGQMTLPHLVRFLLENYGFHGAVLIIGGVALHSIPGCMLYRKPTLIREPLEPSESQPLKPSSPPPPPSLSASPPESKSGAWSGVHTAEAEAAAAASEPLAPLGPVRRLVKAMDLDLLWNLRFMNLAVGTGMIYTTMTSFSMIFPFFLIGSVGLSVSATATCMSVQSGADLVSRLLLPQVMRGAACSRRGGRAGGGKGGGLSARTVMLIGALGSAASRSAMAELSGYTELVAMSAVTGLFRGATVLNQNLVIAEHVKPAKLPAAIGMAMVVKGACVLGIGSALGVVRDVTGSFPLFIHCLTLLALITALSWTLEALICPKPERSKPSR